MYVLTYVSMHVWSVCVCRQWLSGQASPHNCPSGLPEDQHRQRRALGLMDLGAEHGPSSFLAVTEQLPETRDAFHAAFMGSPVLVYDNFI